MATRRPASSSRKRQISSQEPTQPAPAFDYELLASELLRALRGRRSQTAFARRLGYGSNVAHNWEHGRSAPTAARTFFVARQSGVNLIEALVRFYRLVPSWVTKTDLATREGVAALLLDLKGQQSVVSLAEAMGTTRFSIARWLSGKTEPKLPEFLRFVEVASLRLLDFLAVLIEPERLPSVRENWQAMQRARTLAYDEPWTQGVLRALELGGYKQQPHSTQWLAARLGITELQVERCLTQLLSSRQIHWDGEHWQLVTVRALDIGRERVRAQQLRAWWGKVGIERAEEGNVGLVYNLFSVSRADLERLRLLQKRYINELRSIVTSSEPVECVVLAADLLIDLERATQSGAA
jgi:transcriptional regulator with XRE-family HTH domain